MKIKKPIPWDKIFGWSLLLVWVLLCLPLVGVGRYNHPCADDFSYGSLPAQVYRSTGSVGQTIKAAIDNTGSVYHTWQGTFSGVFLMALHPAVFSEGLYAVTTPFLLTALTASALFFFRTIFVDRFGATPWQSRSIAFVFLIAISQFVISPVSAFYWYNGSMYYTLFFSLALVVVGLTLSSETSQRKSHKVFLVVAAGLLGFFVAGGNFVVALTLWVLLGLWLCVSLWRHKAKAFPLLFIVGATTLGLAISVLAPGNRSRESLFAGFSPIKAVFLSFPYALRFLFLYLHPPQILLLVALTPLLYSIAKKSETSFAAPGLVSFFLFALYASSFTPNLYGMGSYGPARVANINQWLGWLMLLALIFYWSGWISQKEVAANNTKHQHVAFSVGAGLLMICVLLRVSFVGVPRQQPATSLAALSSLQQGDAKRYHEEYTLRLALLQDESQRTVVFSPFEHKPWLLFFDDITHDPTDWRNQALADFYGKDSVVLE